MHLFSQCPYKHHKSYVLGERELHNIFSAFGTAVHGAIENKWKHKVQNPWITMGKMIALYCQYIDEDHRPWLKSAFRIYKDFFPWMEKNFPGCELYDIEFKLEETVEGIDKLFLGYIDLILYDPKKDIYHVIDLKTSGWGWGKKQKQDTIKLYQAPIYKKFFCEKMNIDPKKVDCHYVLLLRSPAKTQELALDLFSVTSGPKKMKNIDAWMKDCVKKMAMKQRIKKPQTCSFCVCGLVKKKPKKKATK